MVFGGVPGPAAKDLTRRIGRRGCLAERVFEHDVRRELAGDSDRGKVFGQDQAEPEGRAPRSMAEFVPNTLWQRLNLNDAARRDRDPQIVSGHSPHPRRQLAAE